MLDLDFYVDLDVGFHRFGFPCFYFDLGAWFRENMRLDKLLSKGGSVTLAEMSKKLGLRAKKAKEMVEGFYPNIKSASMDGHTEQYPRYTY